MGIFSFMYNAFIFCHCIPVDGIMDLFNIFPLVIKSLSYYNNHLLGYNLQGFDVIFYLNQIHDSVVMLMCLALFQNLKRHEL